MRLRKIFSKVLTLIGHLLALVILTRTVLPLARFYFSGLSTFGDWHAAYTFTDYLKNHFALPPQSWIYSLKTGAPFFTFYQWLHFYLMQPLARVWGSAWGMEIYSFGALVLFYFFSYILFWELSKNQFFSAFLTVILYYTLGVLNALMQSGFIAQNASQFLLPLTLWLITLHYKRRDKRLLVLAAIFSGLALLGHIGISGFLIFAPCSLVLFFWWDEETALFSGQKFKDSLIYCLTALLIGVPAVLVAVPWRFFGSSKSVCRDLICTARLEQLERYFNPWALVVMLAMIGVGVVWSLICRRNCFKKIVPFFAYLGYIFAYLTATHFRLEIVSGISTTLWPVRTIWAISLGMGAVAATLFGEIKRSGEGKGAFLNKALRGLLAIMSLGLIFWMVILNPYDVLGVLVRNRENYERYGPRFVRYTLDKYKVGPYRNYNPGMVFPEWLPLDETNYRIDDLMHENYGHWPLASKMPVIRSYAGVTLPKFDDWRSWWTAAETDQLGEEEMQDKGRQATANQALFLIDWYGIGYFNAAINFVDRDHPYAPFMMDDKVVDKHEEGKVKVHSINYDFWRIREERTSPIIKATRVPTALLVGDDPAYNSFVRSLGITNTNSQELIPVRSSQKLNDLKVQELKQFDLVILSQYRYDDFKKAWRVLEKYVKEGGSLLIDTGAEVKESDNKTLPPGIKEMPILLPTKTAKREELGMDWDLTITDSPITEGIDFEKFSPLIFEGLPWKLSFVPQDSDLRPGAKVILRQKDKPILATQKLGEGKMIWSGTNLLYYAVHYQAVEEAKFLRRIISWATGGLGEAEPEYSLERPKPERIKVTGEGFSGVLLKENFDSGWKARVNGRRVKVYPAGIDFMYVRVPESAKGQIKVEMVYWGNLLNWVVFLVSLSSLIISLKYVITGRVIGSFKAVGKVRGWWESEEE